MSVDGPSQAAPAERGITRHFIEVDGRRMHYRSVRGPGEVPFVLVHGLVISGAYMAPLLDELRHSAPAYAPDLPGFGLSAGPPATLDLPSLAHAVLQWLDAMGIPRCHLVANSMGCQVVTHCARLAPGRIATLTLIGATIDPSAHRLRTQFWRLVRDAWHEPMSLWLLWARDFFHAGPRRAWQTTQAMFRDFIAERLPLLHTPTLLIRGSKDPTMPEDWSERAVHLLPNAHRVVIPNEPHCVHYTLPGAVAELILRHVENAGQRKLTRNGE